MNNKTNSLKIRGGKVFWMLNNILIKMDEYMRPMFENYEKLKMDIQGAKLITPININATLISKAIATPNQCRCCNPNCNRCSNLNQYASTNPNQYV